MIDDDYGDAESEWYAWGSWLANYPSETITRNDAFIFWNTAQAAIWEQRLKIDALEARIVELAHALTITTQSNIRHDEKRDSAPSD